MGTPVTASQPDVVTTATMADDDAKRKEELNNQLKEYISEWRKTREKEEDELSKLQEKQAKRQEMLEAQKAQKAEQLDKKKSVAGGPISDTRKELSKTKEQLEEEKKIALSIRIQPLELEALDSDELKTKVEELCKTVIQIETDKYDYEQRKLTQELDLKELKERQKAQLRAKALKKGLDPEALTGKYPPKIRMYSKYERRTDTRSYDDRKKLYEGGWEVVRSEHLEASWKEKYDEFSKRPAKKLPKWFGERPGKKMRRNTTRRRNKLFLYFNASVPFDLLVTSYSYILDLENLRNIPDWLVVEMKTNRHHPRLVCHDHQPAPITANTYDSPQPLVISLGCCICSLFLPAVTKQLFFDK